jgi:excisionase family DNA binding protein
METLKVDKTKLITQTEYAKMMGITPPAVSKMIREGRVKFVRIKGANLILLD